MLFQERCRQSARSCSRPRFGFSDSPHYIRIYARWSPYWCGVFPLALFPRLHHGHWDAWLSVAWLAEKWPGRRKFLARCDGIGVWLLGLGSVFSFNILADFSPLGFLSIKGTIFDTLNFVLSLPLIIAVSLKGAFSTCLGFWLLKM